MVYLANKKRKWNRLYSNTWNVACARNGRMIQIRTSYTAIHKAGFGGLEVACWPLVPGFTPGRSRRIFWAKNSSARLPSEGNLGRRSHVVVLRHDVTCKSAFRQNYRTFLTHSSTFRRWVLSRGDTRADAWWRKLERLSQIAQ